MILAQVSPALCLFSPFMRRVDRQVRGRQGGQAQIAIGGRCLDEVGIRLTGTGLANTISHLSFPAHR